jgi:hypothetical protein
MKGAVNIQRSIIRRRDFLLFLKQSKELLIIQGAVKREWRIVITF